MPTHANCFWAILHELGLVAQGDPYSRRLAALKLGRVALWDVYRRATRHGSADAAIDIAASDPNDLPAFLERHRALERILFNGKRAEASFHRHCRRSWAMPRAVPTIRVPSTSPANAATPWRVKVARWRDGFEGREP